MTKKVETKTSDIGITRTDIRDKHSMLYNGVTAPHDGCCFCHGVNQLLNTQKTQIKGNFGVNIEVETIEKIIRQEDQLLCVFFSVLFIFS